MLSKNIETLKKKVKEDPSLIPKEKLGSIGPFSDDNVEQFIDSGFKSFNLLHNETKLTPSSFVMDYGCGIGRVSMYMAKYLQNGFYAGVDIKKDAIDKCKTRYFNQSNFEFHHLNMFNDWYNTKGQRVKKVKLKLKGKFDIICNFSVFTHLVPKAIPHVLNFFKAHLKEDGEVFITLYLITEAAQNFNGPQKHFNFKHPYKGAFVEVLKKPSRAIAYKETHIQALIEKAGFEIKEKKYGSWGGANNPFSYQDILLLKKSI